MKKIAIEFLRRGFLAAWIGPVVLTAVYLVFKLSRNVSVLTADEVCIGILSLTALAFLAGGMNVIYQIESLPLMCAILIHGCVLYVGYLITYLINGWIALGIIPIIVFSAIFVVGYIVIWAIIYSIIRKNAERINEMIRHRQDEF